MTKPGTKSYEKDTARIDSSLRAKKKTSFSMALGELAEGKNLTREAAKKAMKELLSDNRAKISEVEIAAFIMGMATKGEQVEEVSGLLDALMEAGDKVKLENSQDILDTCGTGGDSRHTFNISTLAGLVAATDGVRVVKHGNTSATSRVGSADILNALGVNIHLSPAGVARCVEKSGIGFCFARYFYSSFKRVAAVRQALSQRTVFNVLGPLSNPANAGRQLVGVSDPDLADLIADILRERGIYRALVIYGTCPEGGIDEISTMGATKVIEITGAEKKEYSISPEEFGIKPPALNKLQTHSIIEALKITRSVISPPRREDPALDIVALNAGAALYISDKADSIGEGFEKARTLLLEGKVVEKLESLIKESNRNAEQQRHKNAPRVPELNAKDTSAALEKAFQITKHELAKSARNDDALGSLKPFLKSIHLPKEQAGKIYGLIQKDPKFRSSILEHSENHINPEEINGNLEYLWLLRPVGWEGLANGILKKDAEVDELQKSQNELAKLKKINANLEAQNKKEEKKTAKEKAKKEDFSKKLDHVREELAGEISQLEKGKTEIAEQLESKTKEFDELNFKSIHAHSEQVDQAEALKDAKSRIIELQNENESLREKIGELSKDDPAVRKRAEKMLKELKAKYEVPVVKIQKPLLYPPGISHQSLEAAESLMEFKSAVLILDGYNLVLAANNKKALEEEADALSLERERLAKNTTNIIDFYAIEHSQIIWDSDSKSYAASKMKTSFGDRVKEFFVPNADDGIVAIAKKTKQPVIVVTKDRELKSRLEPHKVNFLNHDQFQHLADRASGKKN